jgi:hypothetical protein
MSWKSGLGRWRVSELCNYQYSPLVAATSQMREETSAHSPALISSAEGLHRPREVHLFFSQSPPLTPCTAYLRKRANSLF